MCDNSLILFSVYLPVFSNGMTKDTISVTDRYELLPNICNQSIMPDKNASSKFSEKSVSIIPSVFFIACPHTRRSPLLMNSPMF